MVRVRGRGRSCSRGRDGRNGGGGGRWRRDANKTAREGHLGLGRTVILTIGTQSCPCYAASCKQSREQARVARKGRMSLGVD